MAPLLTSGALVSAGDRAAQGRRRRACTQWRGRRRQGRTTGVKHQASAPVEVTNRCLCHGHLATPGHRKTRCHCQRIRHRLVPQSVPIPPWAPDGGTNRCLFASFGTGWCFNPVPKTLPLSAAGQRYQLLLQLVPLSRTFGPFSNSDNKGWPRIYRKMREFYMTITKKHWQWRSKHICDGGSNARSNLVLAQLNICADRWTAASTNLYQLF